MAKKWAINCGTCDARNVEEQTLAAYEQIVINAGDVIVTPETKALLSRYSVTMNCGNVLELEKDVRLSSVNGSAQIKATDQVPEKTYLEVNGTLEIGPDTRGVLKQYVGIKVNGLVSYPESMSDYLGMLKVNGSVNCYPDDAVILKRSTVIDRTFALRARNKRYYAAGRLVMVDPKLDGQALADKGASFMSKEAIITESKVDSLIDLIDEQADIVIVPDGTSVILDDTVLDDGLLKKYGARLYIQGDLQIPEEGGQALNQVEYLNVRGDVRVCAQWKELAREKITELAGQIKVLKGRTISNKISARISKWMLEQEKEGISVSGCVTLTLDEDIPKELILERLTVQDCVKVVCTPEQEDVVTVVSQDVMSIGAGSDDDTGIGGMLKTMLGSARELLDTKITNAGDYVL